MADITIVQPHRLSLDQARSAVQRVADEMAGDFEMVSEWQGDVLAFRRSGVSGTLALDDGSARLEMTLGFLLKAFAPAIREKVAANMATVFGAA
ncbi:MAG: polyhydroxyalkanoic acid system family protein [Burkholderiaceae bacterium]